MSLQSVKEAFGRLQALAKEDCQSFPPARVLSIILAAGEYGRALAAAGLYGEARRVAEDFADWILEHRGPDDYSYRNYLCPTLAGEESTLLRIPTPALSKADLTEVSYAECFKHEGLHGRNLLGYYLLYLCSAAVNGEDAQPEFLDHLARCFSLDPSGLIERLTQAATDLYWLARRRLEGPEPAGRPAPEGAQADDNHSEGAPAPDGSVELQSGKRPQREWYGEASEEPPKQFYPEESLVNTSTNLSMALYTRSPNVSSKRVREAHERGTVWVRRRAGQVWEMFFRSKKDLEEARTRLRAWQNRTKTDQTGLEPPEPP
jgi:hypothetical protein